MDNNAARILLITAALVLAALVGRASSGWTRQTNVVALGQACTYADLANSSLNTHDLVCFFFAGKESGGYSPSGTGVWVQSAPLIQVLGVDAPVPSDFARLADLKHYAAPNGGFSFDYPASWFAVERSDPQENIVGVTVAPNPQGIDGVSISWIGSAGVSALSAAEQSFFDPVFVQKNIVHQDRRTSPAPIDTFMTVPRFTFPDVEQDRSSTWFLKASDHYIRVDASFGKYPPIEAGTYRVLMSLKTDIS